MSVSRRFRADRCPDIVSTLTLETLLALVPVVTIAVSFASAFPVVEQFTIEVKVFLLTHLVPESAGNLINVFVTEFSQNAARLNALSTAFLAATAFGLMYTINNAFNQIWRVQRPRPLYRRLAAYAFVLAIGPVMIGASLALSTLLLSASTNLTTGVSELFLHLAPVAFTAMTLFLMYKIIPNCHVRRLPALVGALIAAAIFQLMQRGFAAYVIYFPTYAVVYGTFSAVPIFLMWLYLSWMIVIGGAEISATLHFEALANEGFDMPPSS